MQTDDSLWNHITKQNSETQGSGSVNHHLLCRSVYEQEIETNTRGSSLQLNLTFDLSIEAKQAYRECPGWGWSNVSWKLDFN